MSWVAYCCEHAATQPSRQSTRPQLLIFSAHPFFSIQFYAIAHLLNADCVVTVHGEKNYKITIPMIPMQSEGVKGLVLDLRDNPGGVVSAGVDVARLLLKDGDVFCYALQRDAPEEEARLGDTRDLFQGPMVSVMVF